MPLLSPHHRQRVLQLGFAATATAVVVLADRLAALLGPGPQATLAVLCGRVFGGWALGVAFRLQFTRSSQPDRQLRWLLGLPAGALTAWPLVAGELPSAVTASAPARLLTQATTLPGFAAVALGLVLALSVTPSRRRRSATG